MISLGDGRYADLVLIAANIVVLALVLLPAYGVWKWIRRP